MKNVIFKMIGLSFTIVFFGVAFQTSSYAEGYCSTYCADGSECNITGSNVNCKCAALNTPQATCTENGVPTVGGNGGTIKDNSVKTIKSVPSGKK